MKHFTLKFGSALFLGALLSAGAAHSAGFQYHFRHYCRIATGIQNFETQNINNFIHGSSLSGLIV